METEKIKKLIDTIDLSLNEKTEQIKEEFEELKTRHFQKLATVIMLMIVLFGVLLSILNPSKKQYEKDVQEKATIIAKAFEIKYQEKADSICNANSFDASDYLKGKK
jgi:hypothetical protein